MPGKRRKKRRSSSQTLLPAQSSAAGWVIFAALCLITVFASVVFGGVDAVSWIVLILLAVLIVLVWAGDAWSRGELILEQNRILLPLAGLFIIGLVQIIPLPFNTGEAAGASEWQSLSLDPFATQMFVVRLGVYLIFMAAALTFVRGEKRVRIMSGTIITLATGLAFIGILQRLAGVEAIYDLRITPGAVPFGSMVNQHHFAAFMVLASALALAWAFAKDIGREARLLLSAAVIIMGIAAVMTTSRGALIAMFGAVVVTVVLSFSGAISITDDKARSRSKWEAPAAAAIIILVILALGIFLGQESALTRTASQAGGDLTSGRFHFWQVALNIFAAHPVIGAGYDAFGVAFPRYDTWPGLYRVEQAHNDYLQTLADGGLAAFACVAAFIYLLFRQGLAAVRATSDSRRAPIIGALAGCLGILVHSFFDFPLRTPSNAFVFLMLAAIAVVPLPRESST